MGDGQPFKKEKNAPLRLGLANVLASAYSGEASARTSLRVHRGKSWTIDRLLSRVALLRSAVADAVDSPGSGQAKGPVPRNVNVLPDEFAGATCAVLPKTGWLIGFEAFGRSIPSRLARSFSHLRS